MMAVRVVPLNFELRYNFALEIDFEQKHFSTENSRQNGRKTRPKRKKKATENNTVFSRPLVLVPKQFFSRFPTWNRSKTTRSFCRGARSTALCERKSAKKNTQKKQKTNKRKQSQRKHQPRDKHRKQPDFHASVPLH